MLLLTNVTSIIFKVKFMKIKINKNIFREL